MAKRYQLVFVVHGHEDPLAFEVRERDSLRLGSILDTAEGDEGEAKFFHFDSIDGGSVAINLGEVQAVRFLWDAAAAPSDLSMYDGPVRVLLRGRSTPLELSTESPAQLFDLYFNLELGSELWPKFEDEDGEVIQFNAKQVVWITAPMHLVDEGRRAGQEEDRS